MAKQIGDIILQGRFGNTVGYKTRRSSAALTRSVAEGQKERVSSADCYANLRLTRDENAALFAMNSALYNALPNKEYLFSSPNVLPALNHVTRSNLNMVTAALGERALGWTTYPADRVAAEITNFRKFDFIGAAVSKFSLSANPIGDGLFVRFGLSWQVTEDDLKEWQMYGVNACSLSLYQLGIVPPEYNSTLHRFSEPRILSDNLLSRYAYADTSEVITYSDTRIIANRTTFFILAVLPCKQDAASGDYIPLRSLCSFQICAIGG